jgi:hypothetical protein
MDKLKSFKRFVVEQATNPVVDKNVNDYKNTLDEFNKLKSEIEKVFQNNSKEFNVEETNLIRNQIKNIMKDSKNVLLQVLIDFHELERKIKTLDKNIKKETENLSTETNEENKKLKNQVINNYKTELQSASQEIIKKQNFLRQKELAFRKDSKDFDKVS